jgi:hypothetical protein
MLLKLPTLCETVHGSVFKSVWRSEQFLLPHSILNVLIISLKLKWPLSLKPLISGRLHLTLKVARHKLPNFIRANMIITYYLLRNLEESSWITCTYIEVEINLRPTVSRQPVLVSGSHLDPMTRFLFSVWRLRVSWCGASSPTRGWVRNLLVQLLLGLSGPSPSELTIIFYCLIWDSLNLEGQVPVFISPRNRVAQLYSWGLGSLLSPLTTRRVTVEVLYPSSTRVLYLHILFNLTLY